MDPFAILIVLVLVLSMSSVNIMGQDTLNAPSYGDFDFGIERTFNAPSYGDFGNGKTDHNIRSTFNVLSYGVVDNGNKDDTLAFIEAWNDTCNSVGKPAMIIPRGKSFLVHPTNFTGPCKSDSVKIKLLGKINAPRDPHAWKGKDFGRWLAFEGVNGLSISGGGLLDGHGKGWWDIACRYHPGKGCNHLSPTVLGFRQCKNVNVKNISIVRSPGAHILVSGSEHVHLRSLTIQSSAKSPNTDGIHISNSRNVLVSHSVIGSGDDCISIGDHTSNIHINYINCGPGHGVSIGSLGLGGSVVDVHDITVRNVNFYRTTNGARIKTWKYGRGRVQRVEFSNLNFAEVENPVIIDQYYGEPKNASRISTTGVHISHVKWSKLFGTSATKVAVKLDCSDLVPCTGMSFEDIQLVSAMPRKQVMSSCNNAFGFVKGIEEPKLCLRN